MGGYVISCDLGTGSCKTLIVDQNAKVVGSAQAEYASYYPYPGWVEQNPEDWVNAAGETIQAALKDANIQPQQVESLGIVGVTHDAVLLGKDGKPLRNCILYLDTRSQNECNDIYNLWGDEIFNRTMNSISPVWTWPQLLWIKRNEPNIWGMIDKILFRKDYVRHCIAPSFVTDGIDAAGTLLFDPQKDEWIFDFIDDLGLDNSVFPTIVKPTDIVGEISSLGAELTGLREGTPVIAGTTDTAAEVFGVGSFMPGQGTVKLASVGRITCVTTEPIMNPHSFNYRHVFDDYWYPGTATKYASSAFRWLRDEVWKDITYEEMDLQANQVPPGCNGLIFHPHLQGEWAPYWDNKLRGDFLGLTQRHSRPHFTRAVMEGVAFALRAGMEFSASIGLNFDLISLIGRGSISNIWTQIIADTLNRTIRIPVERDAAYGAALITGIGVEMFSTDVEELSKLIIFEEEREPSPSSVEIYNELFQIYQEADSALVSISHQLNDFDEKYSF
jgi:xylulokinase